VLSAGDGTRAPVPGREGPGPERGVLSADATKPSDSAQAANRGVAGSNDAPLRNLPSRERTVIVTTSKILTPIKAIRAKCLECCCGSRKEVKMCHIINCPLWPYRLGHRPVFPATTRGLAASLAEADHAED